MSSPPPGDSQLPVSLAGRFTELGRDTVLYGLSFGLARSVGLLLLPIYTRHFHPEEFGLYDSALVFGIVLNLLMQAELNGALTRYFYSAGEDRRSLVSTIYAAVLFLSIAFGGAAITVAPGVARLVTDHPDAPLTMQLVVVMAVGTALFSLAAVQLRLEKRIGRYAIVTMLNLVTSGVLGIVFVVMLGWGVPGALLGSAAGAWLGAVFGAFSVRTALGGAFSLQQLHRSLAYSLPLIPAVGAGHVRSFGDRLMILAFLPVSALGVYAVGFKVALIPTLFVEAFKLSWGPMSMGLIGAPDQRTVYRHALRLYVLVVGTLAFGVAAFASELVGILAADAYAGAAPVVGWIVAATVTAGSAGFVAVGAIVAERSGVLAMTNWVGAAVAIGAMTLLVPIMGIEGAALGAACGAVVSIVIMYRMSQRVFRVPYDVRPICAVLVMYFAGQGTVLRWALEWPYALSIASRTAAFVVFTAVSALLLLRRSEWTVAADFLRSHLFRSRLGGSGPRG